MPCWQYCIQKKRVVLKHTLTVWLEARPIRGPALGFQPQEPWAGQVEEEGPAMAQRLHIVHIVKGCQ